MLGGIQGGVSSLLDYMSTNWKNIVVTSLLTLAAKEMIDRCSKVSWKNLNKESMVKTTIAFAAKLPGAHGIIDNEIEKTIKKMETSVFKNRRFAFLEISQDGLSQKEILSKLEEMKKNVDINMHDGKVSGTLYHGGEELTELLCKVENMSIWTNTLHIKENSWVNQCEAEVVQYCRKLYHGDHAGSDVCGTMSSGGTESIILAYKAYRDYAKSRGIEEPEFVVPESRHAAFDKAESLLGTKLVKVPVDPQTSKVDLNALEAALTKNTAFVLGSAPSFANGAIDDIPSISEIVIRKGKELQGIPIPLHVDSCLGSFYLPFAKNNNKKIPDFDFNVPGVTSLSTDTHKFGNSTKGTSVILYRNKKLRHFQYFIHTDSGIGVHATPTLVGSRPGGPIVAAWSALNYFGLEGYQSLANQLDELRNEIVKGIKEIDSLEVIGDPQAMVVSFKERHGKTLQIANQMEHHGWALNIVPGPHIHFCITNKHTQNPEFAKLLLQDLRESIEKVKQNPNEKLVGEASTYNSSMIFPKEQLDDAARGYFDVVYQTGPRHIKV